MKKAITALVVCFSLWHCPSVFGQDTSRIRHVKSADENENEGDQRQARPKKKPIHYHAEVGFELGVNDAMFINSGGANDMILGWSAGIPVVLPLAGRFCLQTGLNYAVYGGEVINPYGRTGQYLGADQLWYIHSIELPVIFGVRFGRPRRSYYSSYIGIGPFAAYNIGGSSSNGGSLSTGTDGNGSIKPYNYGLGLNLGVEWRGGFFLQTKVRWGLAQISDDDDYSMNSFSYGVAMGWLFGKRGKSHIPHQDHYIDPKL